MKATKQKFGCLIYSNYSRMKTTHLFFIPLFFFGITLAAQPWSNICLRGVTIFRDSSKNIQAVRYDTVRSSGTDSIFVTFPCISDVQGQDWVDSTGGTILGRRILKKSNGWVYFFNRNGDTIRLNAIAKPGEHWKFFTLPDHGYLEAGVTNTAIEFATGVPDSVKTISFQARDSLESPISNPFNSLLMKLSKNFGLVKVYDFRNFPNQFSSWEICGNSLSGKGIHPLTWKDVYHYDPGDEFHYSTLYKSSDYHNIYATSGSIFKILSATWAEDSSQVTYQMHVCTRGVMSSYPSTTAQVYTYEGTYSKTFNFSDLEARHHLSKLPGEFICTRNDKAARFANSYSMELVDYPGIQRLRSNVKVYFYETDESTGNLWEPWSFNHPNNPLDISERFVSGLGQTESRAYNTTIDAQLTIGIVKNHANLKFGATNLTNQYYYSYIGGPNIGGYYYGSLTVYNN